MLELRAPYASFLHSSSRRAGNKAAPAGLAARHSCPPGVPAMRGHLWRWDSCVLKFQLDLDWCTFSRKALRQRVRALQGWVEQPPGCARQPATPPHGSRQQQQLQGTALEGLRLMPWLAPAQ